MAITTVKLANFAAFLTCAKNILRIGDSRENNASLVSRPSAYKHKYYTYSTRA
jgi:hypothetical protein